MIGFVVEDPVFDVRENRVGTMRVYVATEERAAELASQSPTRTYRPLALSDMPAPARDNLLRSIK